MIPIDIVLLNTMKKNKFYVLSLAFISFIFGACQPDKKAGEIKFYRNNQIYQIDTTQSFCTLKAYYNLDSVCELRQCIKGTVTTDENGLSGGNLMINWSNYQIVKGKNVVNNLFSDSVLNVQKSATWQIDLEDISPYFRTTQLELDNNWLSHIQPHLLVDSASYQLSGFITLRDSTRNLLFPATVKIAEKQLHFEAKFPISVQLWGATTKENILASDSIVYFKPQMYLHLKAIAHKMITAKE